MHVPPSVIRCLVAPLAAGAVLPVFLSRAQDPPGVLERFGGPEVPTPAPGPPFAGSLALDPGEVVVLVGQENLVREQRAGEIERRLAAAFADEAPRFRFMAWEGDTVHEQRRELNFGSWSDQLEAVGAGTVVAWFGQMEALDGAERLPEFTAAYSRLLDQFATRTRRLVLLSPIPFEKPEAPGAPDLSARNADVVRFVEATRELARQRGALFVDLFTPLQRMRADGAARFTGRDGIHLTSAGVAAVAAVAMEALGLPEDPIDDDRREALRASIVEKNRLWFDCWRPMNWAFAFGDRTTQKFGQPIGDRPWLKEELAQLKALIAGEEARIHALARGADPPPHAGVPGREGGASVPVTEDPAEALAAMTVADGFAVNLFAGEADGVVNPIQISWDEHGRLYVACSPTYPHIEPGARPADYILRCTDEDGDGTADRFERFAENLFMVQGVEPGDGGIYVCAGTELLHLADRDGDGRAEERTVVLSGFGTGDAHQLINSISRGPDGHYWFTQGLHINSHVETPWGIARLEKSGVWRWDPRTLELKGFFNGGRAGHNDWGVAFDDFHQGFLKTGDRPHGYYLTAGMVSLEDPEEYHPLGALFETPVKTTSIDFAGTSHLPDDLQGCAIIAGFMGHTIERYRVLDDGSGFRSEQLPDLVRSTDEAFRPVDISVGPDGAIYACDFHNRLIGHYQTSYRDPGRDHAHGRIWRIAATGRPPVRPPRLGGFATDELFEHLRSPERWVRYQAKRLLFEAAPGAVIPAADRFLAGIEETDPDRSRILLEIAGVFRAHGAPRKAVVAELVEHADPEVRAYGARVAGAWADEVPEARRLLARCAADPHPRVRLEAIVAASADRPPDEAFALFLEVFRRPRDRFLEYALTNAARVLRPHWQPKAAAESLDVSADVRAFLESAAGAARPPAPPGRLVYESLCLNCHQPDGKGLPGIYPPIAGSAVVAGDPEILVLMLAHGLRGRLERNDQVFDNLMPPSGLDDRRIADVLTFIRGSFGNAAGAVSVESVEETRARHADRNEPWTVDELFGERSD